MKPTLLRHAFSSLELTITVGIIALFAAILVPVAEAPDGQCGPIPTCQRD